MKKLTILSLSSLILMGLVACQSESSLSQVASNYTKNETTYQKQGALVTLVNSQVDLAAAGIKYSIDFAINSGYDSSEMALSFSSSPGLYIVDGDTDIKQTLLKGKTSFPFEVTANETGRYYIYAIIKAKHNGVNSTRSLTLIVQVGEQAKSGTSTTTQKGNATKKQPSKKTFGEPVLLPANEDIIQR